MNNDIRDTVLGIYDTVADPSLWTGVLDRFAAQLNAKGCIVFEWQGFGNQRKLVAPHFSSYFNRAGLEKYIEKCFEYEARDQDIFEAHSRKSDRIDLIDDSVLADTREDLLLRPNVAVLQKFDILHRAAGLLNKDNTSQSRFSVQLGAGRGRLTPAEHRHLGAILPHIAKALDLGRPARQLAAQHQSILAAMDRLTIGVCVLDPRGLVVVRNQEFQRQSEAYRVFHTAPTGVLQLARADDQKRFEALKSDALNHGKYGARPRKEAISTDADTYLCIEVTPLTKAEEIGSDAFGGFILYSHDTSLPVTCNTRPIQHAFGLTDAETSLVDAISEGLTNAQIAQRRDRAVATINAQVKSILSKTNCATRTQFVRLMMSFGAVYLSDTDTA
ncbi:MAG: helix-turn-helix transcriptional regulator [Rhodobacter sp.]|nr:helix-turn-helix transcriptional regulator [Rhodobacter sp.]